MGKKMLFISVMIFLFLGILGFAVQKYKEPASQLIFSFVVEKVAADTKAELLKDYDRRVEHEHLTMYYSSQDENLVSLTQNAIDRGIELNSKFIGSYSEPLDLVLLKNREDVERVDMNIGNGLYSHEMNLAMIVPEDREALAYGPSPMNWDYNKLVMHEYSHYILGHKFVELGLSQEDVPYWFAEGFAEYIGSEEMSTTYMEKELLPLKELTTPDQWRTNDLNPNYNIYLQSYLAVRFLIHTYGNTVILDILNETSTADDFKSAFKNVTGIEINELDYYDENNHGL